MAAEKPATSRIRSGNRDSRGRATAVIGASTLGAGRAR